MSTTKIIYPGYFRLVEYIAGEWRFRNGNLFYKPETGFMNADNREAFYGTTMAKVVIELFRINGGKAGYYLANLRDKKYYYCGLDWQNVKITLLNLGIGRDEPMETMR